MGAVADTSLRALELEKVRLRYPRWLQRLLFFRKAKGIHGVHSPLAYRLAATVFMLPDAGRSMETRLQEALEGFYFETVDLDGLPAALALLAQEQSGALWVENTSAGRTGWLAACADARVTLAIDCFDSGLLLRAPGIREKQYLRQRRKK